MVAARIGKMLVAGSKRLSRRRITPFLEAEAARVTHGARVLSVGAGGQVAAILHAAAERRNFDIVETDVDPDRQPDVVDDICASGFPNDSFDVVFISEVLEHVMEPHHAASELFRILKPGGKLVLTVPFMFPIHDRPHDYFRYTEYGLRHLFKPMTIEMLEPRDGWVEAIMTVASRIIREPGRKAKLVAVVAVPMLVLFAPIARWIGRIVRFDGLTTGYVMRASKPSSA